MTKGVVEGRTTGFRAMALSDDCHDVVPSSDTQVTVTPNREGPAMFYHGGSYYIWVRNPSHALLYLPLLAAGCWLLAWLLFAAAAGWRRRCCPANGCWLIMRALMWDLRLGAACLSVCVCLCPCVRAGERHDGLGANSNVHLLCAVTLGQLLREQHG